MGILILDRQSVHTNFDGIRLTRQSSSFGRVISTRDPRIMQLALKFYF
jgi:hypothetical protein